MQSNHNQKKVDDPQKQQKRGKKKEFRIRRSAAATGPSCILISDERATSLVWGLHLLVDVIERDHIEQDRKMCLLVEQLKSHNGTRE